MEREMRQSGFVALHPEPLAESLGGERHTVPRQEGQMAARCGVNGLTQLGLDLDVDLDAG